MKTSRLILIWIAIGTLIATGCATIQNFKQPTLPQSPLPDGEAWRAVHFLSPGKAGLNDLKNVINSELPAMGVNAVILEVGYGFEFNDQGS